MRPFQAGESELPESGSDLEGVPTPLLGWDTLDETELARLAADPRDGARLELLREAEDWLQGSGPTEPCPDASELYDYAPGPGGHPMGDEARTQIRRHLEYCGDCQSLVAGLVARPPMLLDLEPDAAEPPPLRLVFDEEEPSLREIEPESAFTLRRAWIPTISAAAAVMMAWFALESVIGLRAQPWSPPATTLVRGDTQDALLEPVGPILAPSEELDGHRFADLPLFEIAPQPGAEGYRVVVRRTSGSAFDTGTIEFELSSAEPRILGAHALTPGNYSWEAWSTVDGLDTPLGELEFRVVEDARTIRRLQRLAGPDRVRILHEQGYRSDARHEARNFPTSPEMRTYLERPPRGR